MRRNLILAAVIILVIVVGVAVYQWVKPSQTPTELVVVSWGGELQEAEREFFFQPFSEQNKVRVQDLSFTGEYARIKAQVESGNVEWDVVEVDSDIVRSAGQEGLLEPIDYSVVQPQDLMPEAKGQYGVGVFYISTALVWNPERLPQGVAPPNSWKDLWDMKKYPGKRGLRKDPRTTLEIALLADGVDPEQLYPLDVDSALKKLSEIKSDIVWWSSGNEFQQKMLSVYTLASGWNGRVWVLQKEGKPVQMTFNQAIMDLDWWIVLRGAKNKLAMQFLNWTIQAQPQKRLAERMGYGPISIKAAETINPDVQHLIPSTPQNKALHVRFNTEWWAEHEKEVRNKWEAWLLE